MDIEMNIAVTPPMMDDSDSNKVTTTIDDSLYSRQRYVLGDMAMSKLSKGDVFLSGLGGVGIEIAKNIVLAGIKSISLHDTTNTSKYDLSSQFYLNQTHIDSNRATISQLHLHELNAYVKVNTIINHSLSDLIDNHKDILLQFKCIILTESNLKDQIKYNEFCRKNGIHFIIADCYGLGGWVFNDFGEDFKVYDKNGEDLKEVFISNISNTNNTNGDNTESSTPILVDGEQTLIITCMENHMHGFEQDDFVQFKEIVGMDELNGTKHQISVINSNSFSITVKNDKLSNYSRGGIATQVKSIETLNFKPLIDQLIKPDIIDFDFLKNLNFNHLIRHSIELYKEKNQGVLPLEYDDQDSLKFLEITNELNNSGYFAFGKLDKDLLDQELIKRISYSIRGKICPITSILGGFVAQEALKSLTGKFTPLKQWLYMDSYEMLPKFTSSNEIESFKQTLRTTLTTNELPRKYSQLLCLGEKVTSNLEKTNLFMVGSGAIGCEMLKNYALLNVATTNDSLITITDNDLIEKSNLNRQFLFRNQNINQWKSKVAAAATQSMNDKIQIKANQDKIEMATETIYNVDFYNSLDLCVSALDNVEARLYLDRQCVSNTLPLLESGTLSTKGHVQVILPWLTESYASQKDPNEKQVPFCTLKSFPSNLDHCIQWSRDKFEKLFSINPMEFDKFLNQDQYLQQLLDSNSSNKISTCKTLTKMMEQLPKNWNECVAASRIKFEKLFNHAVLQLLVAYPLDLKSFWVLPKRPPTPLKFDLNDDLHRCFIVNNSLLLAQIYGITTPSLMGDNQNDFNKQLNEILSTVQVPTFKSKSKTIISDEKAQAPVESFTMEQFEQLTSKLKKQLTDFKSHGTTNTKVGYLQFEKDDDSNHHIDFITAVSNLRARIYQITESDRFKVKLIAGKIIPAIATTTSVVAGFVSLELIKVLSSNYFNFKKNKKLQGSDTSSTELPPIENFKNYFLNLAIPSFSLCDPGLAPKIKITSSFSYSLWDNWEVNKPEITIGEFNEYFEEKYKLKVVGIYQEVSMIYMAALPSHKKRLTIPIKNLLDLEEKSDLKYIDLFVSFLEVTGEEVKGPPIRFFL